MPNTEPAATSAAWEGVEPRLTMAKLRALLAEQAEFEEEAYGRAGALLRRAKAVTLVVTPHNPKGQLFALNCDAAQGRFLVKPEHRAMLICHPKDKAVAVQYAEAIGVKLQLRQPVPKP